MDFTFNDNQRLFRESAARLAQQYGAEDRPQALRPLWSLLAAGGFLSLGLPESLGGLGDATDIAVVAEAFGEGLLPAPYTASALFAGQLLAAMPGVDELLGNLMTGETLAAVAYLNSPHSGHPVVKASRDGDAYVLEGMKALVIAAPEADVFIVSACLDESLGVAPCETLFRVDTAATGLSIIPTPLIDGSTAADVVFNKVFVTAADCIGEVGSAAESIGAGLRYAILGCCAEMVGLARAALDATIDYVKSRKQFGAPLSDLQAVRHKIADMEINWEMARSALDKLMASFHDPANHNPELSLSLAKATIDENCGQITQQAIQLHGAMGLTEECEIGRFYARAAVLQSLYGSKAAHVEAYVRGLSEKLTQQKTG